MPFFGNGEQERNDWDEHLPKQHVEGIDPDTLSPEDKLDFNEELKSDTILSLLEVESEHKPEVES